MSRFEMSRFEMSRFEMSRFEMSRFGMTSHRTAKARRNLFEDGGRNS